jgi:hypothetical protein
VAAAVPSHDVKLSYTLTLTNTSFLELLLLFCEVATKVMALLSPQSVPIGCSEVQLVTLWPCVSQTKKVVASARRVDGAEKDVVRAIELINTLAAALNQRRITRQRTELYQTKDLIAFGTNRTTRTLVLYYET